MPKVLFIDEVHPKMWTELERMGYRCADLTSADKEEVLEKLPSAHGLVIRSRFTLDKDFLQPATHLQWIARSGVGLENIDLDYCREQDIQTFNAAGGNADAVGEHVIGMLLTLFNKLCSADASVRAGRWEREAHRGIELGARTVGIIGYGNTGRSVAEKLSGFGCEVLAYDKYHPVDGPYARKATLSEIQDACDILSFHVPLTHETRHYLDEAFIDHMRQPLYLVNASRGPVCSTSSIVSGLKSGKILGACLDVLEEEGPDLQLRSKENPFLQKLLSFSQVLLSPHVAGWTDSSYEKLADVLLEKIPRAEGH
ncbi:MAG: phosphoglycerate dehydrogenase [Flavobacteriales bacterium]|nr:phosphoglycerate dehydrogenase [Flavobacteriales bacterium]